ncbi:inositol monophosphatase family protein [Methylocystis parvus]|uniref:3'(2'),5'-bisphosphate nucleotidase CysQ n=1 Tax=Methylocystis parvus TaxID=134 RepID=A0A6B8M0C7_9HYPH|nr:3'(2'),5'-bisphosphate nucleotidase CysQ [Methylocystis parvus]QGM98227.1 3'(2'),5'-bisphosphate nucleotidase CysQ [Methylocystis parvus]WBK01445.1 3'(2'),5'-bisphosphate nucleotidase CysQ [Methylocystis parvus OBBP]
MSPALSDHPAFLTRLEAAAREAGEIAMRYFRPGALTAAAISYKGGGSPVTEADFAVDRFLFEKMRGLAPEAGWLSEETADTEDRLSRERLIIVDPIDGTHAFTRGDERWAVSIALIESGRPVAGVVHAPAREETFTAARGHGAWLNGERLTIPARATLAGARVIAPRPLHARIAALPQNIAIAPRTPSLALRLVDIAAGRHDLVISSPNARDWDIAGADAILREAGVGLEEVEDGEITYNRSSSKRGMLVAAPKSLIEETRNIARTVSEGIDWS